MKVESFESLWKSRINADFDSFTVFYKNYSDNDLLTDWIKYWVAWMGLVTDEEIDETYGDEDEYPE